MIDLLLVVTTLKLFDEPLMERVEDDGAQAPTFVARIELNRTDNFIFDCTT